MAKKKNNKNIIIALIVVVLAAAIIAGVAIYRHTNTQVYSGDGMYYNQQDSGKRIQFNKDKTFSYLVSIDDQTNDSEKGTWSETNGEITLTFDSGSKYVFAKTESGYMYRKDKIFRGKTSDKKLLNNIYVLEENGEVVETLCFMDDGTVDYEKANNSKILHGTYTRVDDILIVRYNSIPDSLNKSPEVVDRYLVLDGGITKEIYAKTPAENIAK